MARRNHHCHATNSGQMIIIGGTDYKLSEDRDPWPQGVGVFDMTALNFKDSYQANAGPYKTPDMIKKDRNEFVH